MTISGRKQKEREDLRRKILDEARKLFIQHGYEHTSIRNIAQKIEYSPTTIYLYFKDKDAIFHALHQEGFSLLNNRMQVLLSVKNPYERLLAMGEIYISFAMENLEFYDLMFIQRAPMAALNAKNSEQWNEGLTAFGMLQLTVKQCMDEGYFRFTDTESAAFMIWSFLHGMIALHTRNRCDKVISPHNRSSIVEKGYSQMLLVLDQIRNK
jgi:AcrR family transcriptional regulator